MNFLFLIIFCLNNYFVDSCIRTSNPDETGGFIPTSTTSTGGFIPTSTTSTTSTSTSTSSSTTSSTTEGTTSSSTTTTTTTSTAPPRCAPMVGHVLFFMTPEVDFSANGDATFGAVFPVSSCAANSCSAGTANYYKSASTATPYREDYPTPGEAINTLSTAFHRCKDLCYCVSSNECFKPSSYSTSEFSQVTFWPYCDTTGFCAVYPFIADGNFKGDMGTNLNASNFLDRTGNPLPVTMSPPYLPLKSVSCSGCPGTSTCP